MDIFISWSGDRSHQVAKLLDHWIKLVLQASRPWISSSSIERGARWNEVIGEQLNKSTIGILCLTQDNKEKPWILFEAGALAKTLDNARVCPLLIDLEPVDVQPPLSQFNMVKPDEEGMRALASTLNSKLPNPLESQVFGDAFATYWPKFEAKFAEIITSTPKPPQKKREQTDVQAEMLSLLRGMDRRMAELENENALRKRASTAWTGSGSFSDPKVFTGKNSLAALSRAMETDSAKEVWLKALAKDEYERFKQSGIAEYIKQIEDSGDAS
jgi:hypothetical protein